MSDFPTTEAELLERLDAAIAEAKAGKVSVLSLDDDEDED